MSTTVFLCDLGCLSPGQSQQLVTGIFDPCYFWPGSVYAGSGMCFQLVDQLANFTESQKACQSDGATLAELRTQQQIDTASNLSYGITGDAGNPCDVYLPGGDYYENSCFLADTKPRTLQEAKLFCAKRDAYLVELKNQTFITYMKQFTHWNFGPASAIWLGLTLKYYTFVWSSTGEKVSASNWLNGTTPTEQLSPDAAVVMNGTLDWTWQVVAPSLLAGLVCQRDLSKECSGVFSSGRCLNMYLGPKGWLDAKAACLAKGAYLAEPKTEVLGRTVEKYVIDTPNVDRAYLGATDLEEGVFVWQYSKQLLSDTYTAWNLGEPNNYDGLEHCLEIVIPLGWNDQDPNDQRSYICENVIPVYIHSYVIVLPRDGWANSIPNMRAMLSLASFPSEQGHNYVEILVFPTGDLHTISLFRNEAYHYAINANGITLDGDGFQQKYVSVRSSAHLDVHFFLWSVGQRYACSSLVFEAAASEGSNTFFSNPGNMDNNLDEPISLDLALSTDTGDATFILNNEGIQIGKLISLSTTMTERYQTLYVESIPGPSPPQVVQSTGPASVFRFGKQVRQHYGTITISTAFATPPPQ
ncbi:hypothetical protein EGW08_004924 [Elysia chlorotica]|uniref:C-type lectin domain-containing protein n=1 Tax=Elysia chlorotica TaxID=188477 RepID=A0A433U0J1_ELYCH|nr:hypothetical protein EGW08_004924 [Elysia chlorotica]